MNEYIYIPECSSNYEWSKKVVIEDYDRDQEIEMGRLRLSSDTVIAMLNALPDGVKWNPYTEQFEGPHGINPWEQIYGHY
ncbi:MAG: hypothetical protein IKS48_00430 [Eubacterium sp.]|nr:hypothetical protein [Eubacterium sp.]